MQSKNKLTFSTIKVFQAHAIFTIPFAFGLMWILIGSISNSFKIGASVFVIIATLCNIALRYASVLEDQTKKGEAILAGENLILSSFYLIFAYLVRFITGFFNGRAINFERTLEESTNRFIAIFSGIILLILTYACGVAFYTGASRLLRLVWNKILVSKIPTPFGPPD